MIYKSADSHPSVHHRSQATSNTVETHSAGWFSKQNNTLFFVKSHNCID